MCPVFAAWATTARILYAQLGQGSSVPSMGSPPEERAKNWNVTMWGGLATLIVAIISTTIRTGYLIPIGITPLHIIGAALLIGGYVMRERALKSAPHADEKPADSDLPPPPSSAS